MSTDTTSAETNTDLTGAETLPFVADSAKTSTGVGTMAAAEAIKAWMEPLLFQAALRELFTALPDGRRSPDAETKFRELLDLLPPVTELEIRVAQSNRKTMEPCSLVDPIYPQLQTAFDALENSQIANNFRVVFFRSAFAHPNPGVVVTAIDRFSMIRGNDELKASCFRSLSEHANASVCAEVLYALRPEGPFRSLFPSYRARQDANLALTNLSHNPHPWVNDLAAVMPLYEVSLSTFE